MRIVCDANVLVRAACRPNGAARALVDLLLGEHRLLTSTPLADELAEILGYARVRAMFQVPVEEAVEYATSLWALSELIDVSGPFPRVSSDVDDDAILATAVNGQADVICTLDRHLRHADVAAFCKPQGIRVLTDAELLAELRAGQRASSDPQ